MIFAEILKKSIKLVESIAEIEKTMAKKKEATKPAEKGFDYKAAYKEQQEIIKKLEFERDAFKTTAEKVSSMHLNKCKEWGERQEMLMDVIRTAYIHIGWYRSKLPFFTKFKLRKHILDLDLEMDALLMKAEGLDQE